MGPGANGGASSSTIKVFAEVTFYSPIGISLFAHITPEEGLNNSGEVRCHLTDKDILCHYNLSEMEDGSMKDHAFTIQFYDKEPGEDSEEDSDNHLIGHIEASLSKSSPPIMKLDWIKTDFRSNEAIKRGNLRKYSDQKLGRRFLAALEDIAKRGGIRTLNLVAYVGVNTFYEKYGYTKTGNATKTNKGENMHHMTKSLVRKHRTRRTRRKSRRNKQ